jgi:hypothetical protein
MANFRKVKGLQVAGLSVQQGEECKENQVA